MRSEQEMMDLIISIAIKDERIRAVYINGSRTNSNAPKDTYQDYDIVYVVTETESFIKDKAWIRMFGNPLIVQEPDRNDLYTELRTYGLDLSRRYAWLMLFDDGNRVDLSIEIMEEARKNFLEDKLTVLLLDKDKYLPEILPPTDEDYHVKKPNDNQFYACCNEFWWCLNNVGKGIARDELPYAMKMFNGYVRDMLNKMVEWYVGINTDFSVSTGKYGKYFKRYLPPELYELYCKTYSDGNHSGLWSAVFIACDLFHGLGLFVAEHCGYHYNHSEEEGMRLYLDRIKGDSGANC